MSELMNRRRGQRNFRRQLLASVSAAALVTAVCSTEGAAYASDDADRPTVWIELGGQFEQMNGLGDPYAPPFTSEIVADGFTSPLRAQRALSGGFGEQGAISFEPQGSDWVFSASVRYGRSQGSKSIHEQTHSSHHLLVGSNTFYKPPGLFNSVAKFSETNASNSETHAILDFQAGKDIGLGLFGRDGTSTVSFGVRFVQFNSKQVLDIKADPDFYVPYKFLNYAKYHHTYSVASRIDRSFHGFGPSISWNASAPLIKPSEGSGIALDWGINAAALFGHQTVRGHHQTVGAFYKTKFAKYNLTSQIHRSGNPSRSRSVIVPNVGGFAGVSYAFPNARLSVGYRADLFFGAMDGGIDTAKKENVGFYGPFARVSVGLGG